MAVPSKDVIEDVTTRFILTAPEEQLRNFESLMFVVEQAHWYYEDYVRQQDPRLRTYNLPAFTRLVFETCPELQSHAGDVEDILRRFNAFKKNVPTMGGILLDASMERVLLVKGWKSTGCWGFPRGKINQNETDMECAVREVLEETGVDLEGQMKEEDTIEIFMDGKRNKLYIVAGVDPDSTEFAPKCRGEIGGYAWHRIADLPKTKEEGMQTYLAADGSRHKFFAVWPYLKPLRKWIHKHKMEQPQWDMPNHPLQKVAQGNGKQQQLAKAQVQAPPSHKRSAAHAAGTQGSGFYGGTVLGRHAAIPRGPGSAETLGSSSSVDSSSSSLAALLATSNKHMFQFDRMAVMQALVNSQYN